MTRYNVKFERKNGNLYNQIGEFINGYISNNLLPDNILIFFGLENPKGNLDIYRYEDNSFIEDFDEGEEYFTLVFITDYYKVSEEMLNEYWWN